MSANQAKPLRLTDAAAARAKTLIAAADKLVYGLRVSVRSRGCSGLSYVIDYAEQKTTFEDEMEDKGVRVVIDPTALMFILGSTMDYREDKLQSGFVFDNPNETGRCGCGESFSVDKEI